MKNIKITVSVDGNEVSREYDAEGLEWVSTTQWGDRILSMLDTIEKSNDPAI